MSAQPLSSMMSSLNLGSTDPSRTAFVPSKTTLSNPSTVQTAGTGNRLPPVMKKYMNPNLVRPPNTAVGQWSSGAGSGSTFTSSNSTSTNKDAIRGPLMKLAGINLPSPNRVPSGSYKPQTHSAHGIHGPAHSTSKRLSNTTTAHTASASAAGSGAKIELGRYDGGLEADEGEDKGLLGEPSKLLEMDSSSSG